MSALLHTCDHSVSVLPDRQVSAVTHGAIYTLRFGFLSFGCRYETSVRGMKSCANYPLSWGFWPSLRLRDVTRRGGARLLGRVPVRPSRMRQTRISSRGPHWAPLPAGQAVTSALAVRAAAKTFRARFGVTHRQMKVSSGSPTPVAFLYSDTLLPPGAMQAAEAVQGRHPGRGEGYACSRRY